MGDEERELMCLNLQMLKASHMVLKTYDDAYRPYGIRATQLPVLSMIANRGPVTMKVISAETATERSVLSRKLQVMEKNGWVKKQSIPGTQEKAYVIAEEGKVLLDRVMPVRFEVQQKLLSNISDEERAVLLSLCDKLNVEE